MPATKGSRISCRSHRATMKTASAAPQNVICRPRIMRRPARRWDATEDSGTSRPVIDQTHVAYPLGHIEGGGEQGQDGDGRNGDRREPSAIEMKADEAEHEPGQDDLCGGVELRNE